MSLEDLTLSHCTRVIMTMTLMMMNLICETGPGDEVL